MGRNPAIRNTLTAMALATWVAGVPDIAFAMAGVISDDRPIAGLLQGIAKGPFRDDPQLTSGVVGALVGLGVHFFPVLIIAMMFVRMACVGLPIALVTARLLRPAGLARTPSSV